MFGIYKHTKSGNFYVLLHIGKNEKDGNKVVIYQALDEEHQIWVRNYDEFFGSVFLNGEEVPRFRKVKISVDESSVIKK